MREFLSASQQYNEIVESARYGALEVDLALVRVPGGKPLTGAEKAAISYFVKQPSTEAWKACRDIIVTAFWRLTLWDVVHLIQPDFLAPRLPTYRPDQVNVYPRVDTVLRAIEYISH